MRKPKKNGFTVLEFLIVMVVIIILSSILFMGRGEGEKRASLQSSAFQIVQNIREAQEMAMGAKETSCPGGRKSYGYGVYFNNHSPHSYLIFADCNGNKKKDSPDVVVRNVNLERGIEIYNLSSSPFLSVVFYPPNPIVYINGFSGGTENAVATIAVESNPFEADNKKVISINPIGMIEIK